MQLCRRETFITEGKFLSWMEAKWGDVWDYCCLSNVSWMDMKQIRVKSSRVRLPFMSLCCCSHAALVFFPRGDIADLDQPCLSTSAGLKEPQGKLFILTSFQENKPHSIGASVPRWVPQRDRAAVSPRAWPHPGSGYRPVGQAQRCVRLLPQHVENVSVKHLVETENVK